MKDFLRQLKLMTNLGFPYTRRDESEIKRKAKAMTRKDTNKRSQKVTSNKELKSKLFIKYQYNILREAGKKGKRKASTSENTSKAKRSRIDINESDSEREISKLEIEERKMKLAERRTADRKAQAEIEKLELENLKLRKELISYLYNLYK
ncbi:hypothetical protein RhiirC2_850808 [Rhizophagus irregularis]|uniref:Uncharacterized protein n=1 Tax=Rhizophagus irregularis TaxID=588596 RepID=A0A2N1N5Y6_9GLOM|nr:hypothetical protein RhiirC2_850808 [Rhizophagus irregularis]